MHHHQLIQKKFLISSSKMTLTKNSTTSLPPEDPAAGTHEQVHHYCHEGLEGRAEEGQLRGVNLPFVK